MKRALFVCEITIRVVVPLVACFVLLFPCGVSAASVELVVPSEPSKETIDLTKYALGQGGLSVHSMFEPHVEQIRQLHPQTIRLFVQEYFDLYSAPGQYHWSSLDK